MTEEQLSFLSYFDENIKPILDNTNSKLAFYGLGINTKFLLEHIESKYIAGLMDAEHTGEIFWGYPVLSHDDVLKKASCIIIVARPAYQNMIYRRISHLQSHGIKICNLYGITFMSEKDDAIIDVSYWRNSYTDLFTLAKKYDVISFDIFDTLITRRILLPYHVFDEVERKYLQTHNIHIPFRTLRYESELKAGKLKKAPSLDDIYYILAKEIGEEIASQLKDLEIKEEFDLLIPRYDMLKLFRACQREAIHKIILVSDMYFNSQQLTDILQHCGYEGWNELLISCEYGKTKQHGDLFTLLKNQFPQTSILHIGDNSESDVSMPIKYGIDTHQIYSSYELLAHSPSKTVLDKISGIPSAKLLGIFCADACNSPFALHDGKGYLDVQSYRKLGRTYLGPVFLCFIIYMLHILKDIKSPFLLLGARDGYIIKKLLDILHKAKPTLVLPPYSYFLISRRAVTLPTLLSEDDVFSSLNGLTGKISVRKIMDERFSLKIDDDQILELPVQYPLLCNIVKTYTGDILRLANKERINYLRYINGQFDLVNKNIVLFDSMSSGTIPVNLQKLLQRNITLLTMCYFNQGKSADINIKTMLDYNSLIMDDNHPGHFMARYFMLIESIMTSRDGQFIHIDDQGCPVFADNLNTIRLAALEELWEGIIEYVIEYFDMINVSSKAEYQSLLGMADNIFSELVSGHIILNEQQKQIFVNDAYYTGGSRLNLWKII